MRSRVFGFLLALMVGISGGLSGCQSNPSQPDNDVTNAQNAAVVGAVIGGVIGLVSGDPAKAAKFAAMGAAAGAVVAYFGPKLLRALSPQDQQTHVNTRQTALRQVPDGDTLEWENPDTLASGSIELMDSYMNSEGMQCRTSRETITVNGQTDDDFEGAFCQASTGEWEYQEAGAN